ncbi:MAG: OmpH family outer membrane protein [bacterium]|nr:OmpH family outer membrane protein [bacterium]MCZ6700728.1 OmpH family outer membrane protein [bacterium]
MTRRSYSRLVGLSVGAVCLVWSGLNGSPAKGAESQMRPAMLDSTIKVGTVDLNRAFRESKSVSAAKTKLIQDRKNKLQALKARREEIKVLGKEIQNQRALLSEVVQRQKEGELRKKLRTLERLRNDSEQELNRRYLSINRFFLADAKKTIGLLGKDAGYTIIISVDNDLVLYGAKSVDVTDQLIQLMNNNQ